MATRSGSNSIPFWGRFATAALLPNVAASPTQLPAGILETGDQAYVTGTSTFYVCTTATPGAAVWAPIAAGANQSRYYDIVVGNSPAGDTATNCDFLDVGDGEQLQAALVAASAANPKKSVFVRRGTYDRGAAGSDGSALVVAAGVLVVGDGPSCVIKVAANPNTHATKTLTVLDVSGEVRDLAVSVPLLTNAATTGTGVIKVEAGGTIRNIATTWTAGQTVARLGATVCSIDALPGALVLDCSVTTAPVTQADGATPFACIRASGTGAAQGVLTQIERFDAEGSSDGATPCGGYGVLLDSALAVVAVQVFEARVYDAQTAAFAVLTTSAVDTEFTNPRGVWRDGGTTAGVRSGFLLDKTTNVQVTGGYLDNGAFGISGTTVGIRISSNGATCGNNEFLNMHVANFDEAVHCESTGGGVVNANGVVDSFLSNNASVITNVNDVAFRTGGNW